MLFCLLGTFILVPIELRYILAASKREYGTYSLKSAFVGQEKMPIWKTIIIAFVFFGIAGLLSTFIAPVENQIFADIRATVLSKLPVGFDWTNFEYLKSFSRPVLIVSCVYYSIFNALIAPVAYVAYKKKNMYISIFFHCFCNLFSVIGFVSAVLG